MSTSNNIDMKLGSVIKLDKRNMAKPKQIHDDAMSTNRDVIAISDYWPIRSNPEA